MMALLNDPDDQTVLYKAVCKTTRNLNTHRLSSPKGREGSSGKSRTMKAMSRRLRRLDGEGSGIEGFWALHLPSIERVRA